MKIFNSLSLNMIPEGKVSHFLWQKTYSISEVVLMKGLKSFVGHNDLAKMLYLPTNRGTAVLEQGECFLVAQYYGERLPEGATELPEGANIVIHEYMVLMLDGETANSIERKKSGK